MDGGTDNAVDFEENTTFRQRRADPLLSCITCRRTGQRQHLAERRIQMDSRCAGSRTGRTIRVMPSKIARRDSARQDGHSEDEVGCAFACHRSELVTSQTH